MFESLIGLGDFWVKIFSTRNMFVVPMNIDGVGQCICQIRISAKDLCSWTHIHSQYKPRQGIHGTRHIFEMCLSIYWNMSDGICAINLRFLPFPPPNCFISSHSAPFHFCISCPPLGCLCSAHTPSPRQKKNTGSTPKGWAISFPITGVIAVVGTRDEMHLIPIKARISKWTQL